MKMRKKTCSKDNKKIVLFYHDDHDGFGAAWAAWKKFKNRARYIPIDHPTHFQDIKRYNLSGTEIYFLDICLNKEDMEHVRRITSRVIVIDHHISKKDVTASFPGSVFDIGHSGAFLAWKYFHPRVKMPKIIKYVQDIDLWQWKLRGTEALFVALPWTFKFNHWNKLARILENKRLVIKYIRMGTIMLQYKTQIIDAIIKDADEVRIGNIRAFAVNAPSIIHSEVGNALTKKLNGVHVGISFRVMNHGAFLYIFLCSDGVVDVSKIAQKYGGGGHKKAAAFVWPLRKPLPFTFVGNK